MDSWELLKFPQKHDLEMTVVPLNRNDIKKGNKYRLFMVKPKSVNEVVHKYEKVIQHDGMQIWTKFHFKCSKTPENSSWNGKISKTVENYPISGLEKHGYYIHFTTQPIGNDTKNTKDCFAEDTANTIKLDSEYELGCMVEISEIKQGLSEIHFADDNIKIDLVLDWEKMLINGNIEVNISCDKKEYHSILQNRWGRHNLISEHYHHIRATYQVIKKNANKYVGELCPEYLSKSLTDLKPPKQIEFTHKEIYQMVSFSENYKLGSGATVDVTDWSGQCLDPIVRTILQPCDIVRCDITFGPKKKSSYRPYFVILDIIDENSFYGELQDPYWDNDYPKDMIQYTIAKINFNAITEIPVNWQVGSQKEKLEKYLLDVGYSFTGASVQ